MNKVDITTDNHIRRSNFELLRIIAMCMIICMHYMTKGMHISKLSADSSLHNIFFWIIYAFCLSSVNAYVFISGYFSAGADWKFTRLLRLWIEVLIYSVGIPLVTGAYGQFDIGSADLSVKQQIFLPVTYEHYWFATAYIMLCLLVPVLNVAVSKLDKKTYGIVLIALIAVFCGFKSLNPYLIPWDKYGNDVIWFVVLYLIGGYIRLYGVPFMKADDGRNNRIRSWLVYIVFSVVTFLIALAFSVIVRHTGKLEYYMDMTYCYNYITVLIASIGLFCAFASTDIKPNKWINRIAGYTFGVYLIHDNIVIRELWPEFLGIDKASEQWWQVFHMLLCIVTVFAAGCILDSVRSLLFDRVFRKKN